MRVILCVLISVCCVAFSFAADCRVNQAQGSSVIEVRSAVRILDVVRGVIEEIRSATDNAIAEARDQAQFYLREFFDLASNLNVTGPIQEAGKVVTYWLAILLQNDQILFSKTYSIFARILASIRYPVIDDLECTIDEANYIIAGFISEMVTQIDDIRAKSTQQLTTIIVSGTSGAVGLNQQALHACNDAQLVDLEKKFNAAFTEFLGVYELQWSQRLHFIHNVSVVMLQKLLVRIQQFLQLTY